jgi:cbb3-type cytochrome oxidase maturation protein
MEVLVILVPLALGLGLVGLFGFLWSLKSGQYDDLEGAAWRAIADDEPVRENVEPLRSVLTVRPSVDSDQNDHDQCQERRCELRAVNSLRASLND